MAYDKAMKIIITILCTFFIQHNIFADEESLDQKLAKIWVDGKITPEQPFPAKVIAAGGISPWSAKTHIYLQEIGEKKRYCIAMIYLTHLPNKIIDYKILEEKPDFNKKGSPFSSGHHSSGVYNACLFTPAVPLDRFVWIEALNRGVGKKFGDKDLIHIQVTQHHNHQKLQDQKK